MPHLYMLLVGCSPKNRHIEQHDIFFGIGESIADVLPQAMEWWPESKDSFHLDAWRKVSVVNNYRVSVHENNGIENNMHLFFINLGGYKPGEFEEFHYKMIVPAPGKNEAIKAAKQTAFFKHTGFTGATAHIDDKYGVDVDNVYTIRDILPVTYKQRYSLLIEKATETIEPDTLHLGYFRPGKIEEWGTE